MSPSAPKALYPEGKHPAPEGWVHQTAATVAELTDIIDAVVAAMKRAGYSSKDLFAVRLSLEEAGINAIKHGHRDCRGKPIRVSSQVGRDQVIVEVEDQGKGFDPHAVPDPLDEANMERSCGRGLLLMRCYTTWLSYNEYGNRVTFGKRRSAE
jgi:serine/threonine-protein kinase RsbW